MKAALLIISVFISCTASGCKKNSDVPDKPTMHIVDLRTNRTIISLFSTEDKGILTADSIADTDPTAHINLVRDNDGQFLYERNNGNAVEVDNDDENGD